MEEIILWVGSALKQYGQGEIKGLDKTNISTVEVEC